LETGNGRAIIGDQGPIIISPAEKIDIGTDGTISIIPLGENEANLAVIDRIKLAIPELTNLEKLNDGLMYTKDGTEVVASANISLIPGALEGSNVNGISAMVNMIELARNFELQTKVMKNANDNSAVSAKLMQMA
jgi:flagellar basal-body rod protein FlgF